MPTAKKTDDTTEEEAPTEETAPVCVNCGQPATVQTTNSAVNRVYYCDQHGQRSGEPVTPIGR